MLTTFNINADLHERDGPAWLAAGFSCRLLRLVGNCMFICFETAFARKVYLADDIRLHDQRIQPVDGVARI